MLVASPHLGSLHVLGLSKIGEALEPLLHLPILDQLTELDLRGNNVSDRHRVIFEWDKKDLRHLEPSDVAVTLRRALGPHLKL